MMVSRMSVQYICNECGKTGTYSAYGLQERIEKLYEKSIKYHVGSECVECHKGYTIVRHAEMKLIKPSVFPMDIRCRYELDWHCKDCGRTWSQYRYLTKRQIEGENTTLDIKSSTNCICGHRNRDFFLKGFTRKLQ